MLEAESTFSHWSLFNRFIMAAQMLDAADAAGGWVGLAGWLSACRECARGAPAGAALGLSFIMAAQTLDAADAAGRWAGLAS